MKRKTVLIINTIIFVLVALAHLWRAITGTSLNIAGLTVGVGVSWLAFVVLLVVIWLNYSVLKGN